MAIIEKDNRTIIRIEKGFSKEEVLNVLQNNVGSYLTACAISRRAEAKRRCFKNESQETWLKNNKVMGIYDSRIKSSICVAISKLINDGYMIDKEGSPMGYCLLDEKVDPNSIGVGPSKWCAVFTFDSKSKAESFSDGMSQATGKKGRLLKLPNSMTGR